MTKIKWIYLVVIIISVGAVLFFYNAFNGNPISKMTAQSTLKNHLESNYPDDEFVIQREFYNFKDGGYNFYVTQIGEEEQTEYEFILTGFFGSNIHSDGIYYANQDVKLISKLQKEASEEITNLLQEKVPEVLEVTPQLEVLKGKYPSDANWSKDFKAEKPMYIHITIDSRKFSKEDMLHASILIQRSLHESNYTYEHITINGNIIDENYEEVKGEPFWVVKYAVGFEHDTKLTLKDIEQYE
ncbi:hypothetical protein CSV79_01305 [Sporosarcina sp. P13]|uniref:YfjL-like protein n=1 Tax=Sporosarcina sp. P13 TaxID=2048263 RepID=UPI000C16880A|nr:DUF3139 domain-containing protein [Sporosarcina sp. P13]PIC65288.1 hypothetical protein CSV79_01305 [Sporosarcina sp. P13]